MNKKIKQGFKRTLSLFFNRKITLNIIILLMNKLINIKTF
ncbi:hypothetical protein HDEF_0668 [Candidatus Hamiltonella defensa 5AT (Acyrthosiphon pisum)]|uniref:Uncharacterized protein n=1 Tax=Hamiltonella defensa subsp. Acyrthosiphon pisum (strain 5AT) TaxID=572265 RepID=C4K4B3_HAMD5|nr:hypothetical protein HDEF_0668 [Candidatus Hamiltonella defensa 5AT (Acyrthosiphon pisum)]